MCALGESHDTSAVRTCRTWGAAVGAVHVLASGTTRRGIRLSTIARIACTVPSEGLVVVCNAEQGWRVAI